MVDLRVQSSGGEPSGGLPFVPSVARRLLWRQMDRGFGDAKGLSLLVRDLVLLQQRGIVVDAQILALDLQQNLLPDRLGRDIVPVAAVGEEAVLVHLA